MSKLEELIQQYCPDGVEYKEVQEVAKTTSPKGKLKSKDYLKEGKYPVIDQGQSFIGGYTNEEIAFEQGEYVIFGDHTCVVKYVNFSFVQGADGVKVITASDVILPRFLYYCMSNIYMPTDYARHWSKMKVEKIPIPPLPVQEEIVRILDTFRELQAELQAELQKRLQQYNYYRDNLLSFEGRTDVEWISIDQLFLRRNGYTPSKSNVEFWTNGTIPWFRMEDIRENGRILTNSIQKIHPSAVKKNALFKSGSIIVATSATIGEHALVLVDCLANQRFTCLTVKDEYKNKVDNMFLFYYMFKVDEWCKTHTVQGNFPGVDMSQFPSVLIPLPSIEEQKRIATILDRFNSLTTDITAGLPAEIEARRKQYEYYRDQLLTFKQKA